MMTYQIGSFSSNYSIPMPRHFYTYEGMTKESISYMDKFFGSENWDYSIFLNDYAYSVWLSTRHPPLLLFRDATDIGLFLLMDHND
jgi:hypothetical protein